MMAANNNLAEAKMQEDQSGTINTGEKVESVSQVVSNDGSCGVAQLPPVLSSSASASDRIIGTPRGENMCVASTVGANEKLVSSQSSTVAEGSPTREDWRFQVTLDNGQFTPALKDDLFRDLNKCLYSDPSSSFIPSFGGSGLRFGVVWFSPDNEESYNWLIDRLTAINEKAGEFRFTIEPYSVHQNRICIRIPWDSKEGLRDVNVLKRIRFQNPSLPADRWKVSKSQTTKLGDRLLFCSIDDTSLELLQKQKFRLNYGFQKVQADVMQQKKSVNSKKSSINSRMENL